MKTQTEVRKSFWNWHPQFKNEFRTRKRQNEYSTDIRVRFVDFVDMLRRNGEISEKLANRVTL